MEESVTGAEAIHWNLGDLYENHDQLDTHLTLADQKADAFAERYRGRVAETAGKDFAGIMEQLEQIHEILGRAYTYAYLHWVTGTDEPPRGALLQKVKEAYTRTSQKLIFFEIDWANAEDQYAENVMASESVARWRHYLELQRLHKKHLLTEPEEKILAEKSVTGSGAWNRYFDETISALRFDLDGKTLTEQEVLTRLYEPDRELRHRAADALTAGLKSKSRDLTYIFNTILADKATDDRLRHFDTWLSSRNVANEVADDVVHALTAAVTSRYDLVARFYTLKKKLLGVDVMMDYDRYAPVGESDTRFTWTEARDVVTAAYHRFEPRIGGIVGLFFEGNWIDAALSPGKRGGAFSHSAVPSAHPYILMNFTGKSRDVQTLAHELGHGVHQYLSRGQGIIQADTPLTTAETASVFGEMLVFQELLKAESNRRNRLSMLVGKIDDTIATVFRQVAMNRFEDRIHTRRREEGELSSNDFADAWMATQRDMFRGSVTLGDHYRHWWSYIPHFLHTPGYVYAYAFGELLVLALYQRYLDEGASFADKYVRLLEAGGSDWPHVLVGRMGIDLTDLGFWQQGLDAIEALIRDAEALAEE